MFVDGDYFIFANTCSVRVKGYCGNKHNYNILALLSDAVAISFWCSICVGSPHSKYIIETCLTVKDLKLPKSYNKVKLKTPCNPKTDPSEITSWASRNKLFLSTVYCSLRASTGKPV